MKKDTNHRVSRVLAASRRGLLLGAAVASLAASLPTFAAPVLTKGFLKFEYWAPTETGTPVQLLLDWPDYPNNPALTSYASSFDSRRVFPDDSHEQYGGRLTGWLTPTETAEYNIFLKSDDASELWLSTDDKEANLAKIAEQTGCCNAFTEPGDTVPYTTATPIRLEAGKQYYVQALYKEGGGGDYVQVAWRKVGDTTPAALLAPINGSFLSSLAESAGASVTVTNQPQSVSVTENSAVTFTVGGTATTPFKQYPGAAIPATYQWYKNGAVIPGATSASYTVPQAKVATDNGAKFKAAIIVPGVSQDSAEATLTVTADTVAPTLVKAAGTALFKQVTVSFSEPVDPATATVLGNYSFTPALGVTAARVSNLTNVVLTTAVQTPATAYTLTATNIKDGSGNTIGANSKVTFSSYINSSGVMLFAFWDAIPATPVQGLLDDPRYPNSPDLIANTTSFDSRGAFPDDSHENYGGRLSGLLTPTKTADYDFFIRSDDASQLYISTDATEANATLVAEETGCCGAFEEVGAPETTATPIRLVAGKQYYVYAIYKEGGGGDYVQVAWRETTDTAPANTLTPIPGKYFSSPVPPEGLTLSTSPTPNATDALPDLIKLVHVDGVQAWTAGSVTVKVDGTAVTPEFSKEGSVATITYVPATPFASKSKHTVDVTYPVSGGGTGTYSWSFTVATLTKDVVNKYNGLLMRNAAYTLDAGGHTAKAGDYGMNLPTTGGYVFVPKGGFLNAATANDELAFSVWTKKYENNDSSLFWAKSPTSSSSERGFQAHAPWSDSNIYFDTAGCCDGTLQRISAGISTFDDYNTVGDVSWWTNKWHHFVFSKKANVKQIWIDGKLFLEGTSDNPLPTDFRDIFLGAENHGANMHHGLIDDFAMFGTALSEADVNKLYTGTSPTALGAGAKILAFWDFNDAVPVVNPVTPTVAIAADGADFKVTYTGTLQGANAVTGPWADVTGASPVSVPASSAMRFFRAKQ